LRKSPHDGRANHAAVPCHEDFCLLIHLNPGVFVNAA